MHPTQPIPGGDQSNPYDFILNGPPKKKRTIVPKGNSKKQRLIIMIGGGLALLTLLIIIFSLIFGGGGGGLANLEKTVKEQQEIMRVAQLGEKGARSTETQTFAISTKLTVSSSQSNILAYLADKGSEVKGKDLSENLDSKTDTKLKTATDNGEFDTVFTALLTAQLEAYKQNLAEYYDATSSKNQRQLLQEAYNQADGLLKKEATEETP